MSHDICQMKCQNLWQDVSGYQDRRQNTSEDLSDYMSESISSNIFQNQRQKKCQDAEVSSYCLTVVAMWGFGRSKVL